MAERDFDVDRKKRKKVPGHVFTLGEQKFRTYGALSLTASRATIPDDQPGVEVIINFIRSLVVKEDRNRFDAMMSDPMTFLDAEDIIQVSDWLIAELRKANASRNGASRRRVKKT